MYAVAHESYGEYKERFATWEEAWAWVQAQLARWASIGVIYDLMDYWIYDVRNG